MTVKVVGAGLGRTGTHSLKLALERLLGAPCYHMSEMFPRPEHVAPWHQAMRGNAPDWDVVLAGFDAIVDWPGAAVWQELASAYPDAIVVLSERESPDQWWTSFSQTILQVMQRDPDQGLEAWHSMAEDMLCRLTPEWTQRDQAMAAYESHNQAVRDAVPAGRLVEWRPGAGWGPLCAGLRVAVPDEAFPHVNTTDDFRAMAGLVTEP